MTNHASTIMDIDGLLMHLRAEIQRDVEYEENEGFNWRTGCIESDRLGDLKTALLHVTAMEEDVSHLRFSLCLEPAREPEPRVVELVSVPVMGEVA